jgi:hypothetical protein
LNVAHPLTAKCDYYSSEGQTANLASADIHGPQAIGNKHLIDSTPVTFPATAVAHSEVVGDREVVNPETLAVLEELGPATLGIVVAAYILKLLIERGFELKVPPKK